VTGGARSAPRAASLAALLAASLASLLAVAGCQSDAPPTGVAPRLAGSTIPMAPGNAEGAGGEPVPQTWVSSASGGGARPGRGAPTAGPHGGPHAPLQPPKPAAPTEL
jgi:hypothetical protein